MAWFDWQTVVALIIVALAAGFVARRMIGLLNGRSQSGCASCPSRNSSSSQLVTLDSVKLSPSLKSRSR